MSSPSKHQTQKVGLGYRILSGLFFLCVLIGTAGISFALATEPFAPTSLIAVMVCLLTVTYL
jgi:hypothetical protein